MVNSSRASKNNKHKVSWKDALISRFRKCSTNQENMSQSPTSSIETSPTLSMDANQTARPLVRSNARAKSPRNPQAHRTARSSNQPLKSKTKGSSGNLCSTTFVLGHEDMTKDLGTEISPPPPPPYVLSLPEAVVTPPSLVALTDDELRSRGIYSPHPATEHETHRPSMSRNTSFRSALSMFAPRVGRRPTTTSGNGSPHSQGLFRDLSASFSSTLLAIGICISVLIVSLDRGSITTAIPSILADFESPREMGWYGSAYLLTASAFQPMYGRIYTSFNVKWSFLISVLIFEVGALVCAIAPTSEAFLLGRAVQGLGSAGISTGSSVLVTQSFGAGGGPALLTSLDVLSWVGTVAGPVLGAVFSQLLSWEWCYYLNLTLAGTTFACVLLFSKSHQSRSPRPNLIRQASDFSSTSKTFARRVLALDWIGTFLFMAACTFLFMSLQMSQEKDFDRSSLSWIIFTSLCVITMLLCVLWMQIRGDNALTPFHIMRQRTVAVSCGASFFLYGAFTIHIYYFPIWIQVMKSESPIESGIAMIPYMLTMALLSLVAGRYLVTNGHFALSTIFGCGIATVGAGLMTMLSSETSTFTYSGFQMVMAAGLGVAMQNSLSTVQAALPPHEVPIGTAAVHAYQNAGGAIFVSVGNLLFQKCLLDNESDIDIRAFMKLGVTKFPALVPDEAYSDVLKLYGSALRAVFIAVIPLCGIAFLLSWCMNWTFMDQGQEIRTPGMTNVQGFSRGLTSPELGSDAPTLAHLAPRARQRWSQRWSGPIVDVEAGQMRLSTVMQELNGSESSISSFEDATDAEIKEMDIGRAH